MSGGIPGFTSDVKNTNGTTAQQSTGTTNVAGTTLGTNVGGYNAFTPFGESALQNLPNYWGQANSLVSNAAPALNYGTDVQPLLSPYAAQQVAATFDPHGAIAQQQAHDLSAAKGTFSDQPYGSAGRGEINNLRLRQEAQNQTTAAGIYGTSAQQALTTAEQEKARQSGLAATSGSLQQQQLAALQGLIGLGGTYGNTTGQQQQSGSSTGNVTGQTASTTTDQPSLASTFLGAAGAAAKFLPFLATGGAIKGYDAGGAVSTPGAPLGGTAGPGAEATMPSWMGNTAMSRPMTTASAPQAPMQSMGQPMAQPPSPNPMGGTPQSPMMPFSGQLAPQGPMPGMPPNPVMPKTFAAGGAVEGSGMPSGDDFSGKVMSAFKAFHAMRKHAQDGGAMKGYDDGGSVDDGGWGAGTTSTNELGAPAGDSGDWIKDQALYNQGVIDTAPKQPSMMSRVAGALGDWGKSMQRPAPAASAQSAPQQPSGNPALTALGQAMSGLRPAAAMGGRMGYEGGGDVEPTPFGPVYSPGTTEAPPDPNAMSAISPPPERVAAPMPPVAQPAPALARAAPISAERILGAAGYTAPSKWDTFTTGLMNTPRASGAGGLFSGLGKQFSDAQEQRLKAAQLVMQAAEASGQVPGLGPTLAAQKLPDELAHMRAQTKLAEVNSDKEFLLEMAKRKAAYAKELALAQQEGNWDLIEKIRGRYEQDMQKEAEARSRLQGSQGGGQTPRRVWTPPVEAPAPAPATAPVQPTPTAPVAPAQPEVMRNARGVPVRGTQATPWDTKAQAGYGEYYKDASGALWRRGSLRSGDSRVYQ